MTRSISLSRHSSHMPSLPARTSPHWVLNSPSTLTWPMSSLPSTVLNPPEQTGTGYIASNFGLLNIFFRPTGGTFGDVVYRRWGVPARKYSRSCRGVLQGVLYMRLGIYIDSTQKPKLVNLIAFALNGQCGVSCRTSILVSILSLYPSLSRAN